MSLHITLFQHFSSFFLKATNILHSNVRAENNANFCVFFMYILLSHSNKFLTISQVYFTLKYKIPIPFLISKVSFVFISFKHLQTSTDYSHMYVIFIFLIIFSLWFSRNWTNYQHTLSCFAMNFK